MSKLVGLVEASIVVHNMLIGSTRDEAFYVADEYMGIVEDYPLDDHGDFLQPSMPADSARQWYRDYFETHNYFWNVQTRIRQPART